MAYNIRKRKSTSIEQLHGWSRTKNLLRELLLLAACAAVMYVVYLIGKRFL